MICLCNPLNPTGKVFTKEELKTLGEMAVKHDLIILSDEIWSDIIFAPHGFTSIASIDEEIKKRTITITGFSKSYGLAALRVGALFCPDASSYSRIFAASMHSSTVHGCNVTGQIAATAALDECGEWLAAFVAHLHKMRDCCVDGLNDIKGISCMAPQGCYVAFADITGTGKSSAEVQQLLMNEAKVAVVPGLKQWFGNGAEGYIRLSFATSFSILSEGISRIKSTLN
jgi:bifunctional pyridoxal-dependent enzyme with beta-cystathionase and maltose regulon repressor activities